MLLPVDEPDVPVPVVRGAVLGCDVVVPDVIPPMLVVGAVLPMGGVVPVVVLGVVAGVPGVVPVVVLGVVAGLVVVVDGVDVEPGIVVVVVVDAPGTVAGAVDGVHGPVVDPEVEDAVALVPTDDVPMVLPVGFVDVLGVVELIGQLLVCELGDAVGLTVLEGAMPPVPVVRGLVLPVIDGVLLPPVEEGADVCAAAIAAAKHTTVTRMSTDLLMRNSPWSFVVGWLEGQRRMLQKKCLVQSAY